MKGLLIKDFYLNFLNKRTAMTYLAITLFMSFTMSGSFIVGYTAMLMGILAISTLSYDEMDNGFPFLMSLPVSRKTYVTEKYVYFILLDIIGGIFGTVIYIASAMIKGEAVDLLNDVPSALAVVFVMAVMLSIMLPIQLKYGVEKSRVTMMVIYGAIFAICMLISQSEQAAASIANVVEKLENSPQALVLSLMVLAGLTILFVSYMISVRIMKNKEF